MQPSGKLPVDVEREWPFGVRTGWEGASRALLVREMSLGEFRKTQTFGASPHHILSMPQRCPAWSFGGGATFSICLPTALLTSQRQPGPSVRVIGPVLRFVLLRLSQDLVAGCTLAAGSKANFGPARRMEPAAKDKGLAKGSEKTPRERSQGG